MSTREADVEAGGASVVLETPSAPGGAELSPARVARVGEITVRRLLPLRRRRSVGPWCFIDHYGPVAVDGTAGMDVPPHPHIGLQTVTWLISGEVLHRDSLGSEQLIRPGQLNLMTAGRGLAHAEESLRGREADPRNLPARSPDLHFGLGRLAPESRLRVDLRWRDPDGRPRAQTLLLSPGWHTVLLGQTPEGGPRRTP